VRGCLLSTAKVAASRRRGTSASQSSICSARRDRAGRRLVRTIRIVRPWLKNGCDPRTQESLLNVAGRLAADPGRSAPAAPQGAEAYHAKKTVIVLGAF
jgi:hypothetical protein